MTNSLVMPESVMPHTHARSERPISDWCYFLIEHLDEFAKLAWYLVADTALVECVMVRTVARLESIPFSASDAVLTYNQTRDMLIGEAIAALDLPPSGCVETDWSSEGPVGLCGLPDLPRLAFLLRLVLRMPQSEVARLLSITSDSLSELISLAILQLSHRLPASSETLIADA